MSERIRIDETSNPIDIKMRRIMKGHFMRILDEVADSHSYDIPKKFGMMIYGSTVMRELVHQQHYYFPLAGLKSSDIDIGGCVRGEYDRNTTTKQEFAKYFAPLLAEATHKAGFDLWIPKKSFSGESAGKIEREFTNAELDELGPSMFVGDYYIAMKFTKEQIIEYLQHDPEFKQIKPYITNHFDKKGREYKTVCIAISAHDEHFPSMMEPQTLINKDTWQMMRIEKPRGFDELPLLGLARRYDMLAGKIARSMSSSFKPSDLIDIYNLVTGSSYLDYDQNDSFRAIDTNNLMDMETVRLLTLNYLLCGYRYFDPYSDSLLANFENTPENKAKVTDKLKSQIVEYKQPELFGMLDEIYSVVGDFVKSVFREVDPKMLVPRKNIDTTPHGPLNLTIHEINYARGFSGKAPLEEVDVEIERTLWQKLLLRPVQTRKELAERGPAEFAIKLDEIEDIYPRVFMIVYEDKMANWLKSNTILNAKLRENQWGKEAQGAAY